MTALEKYNQLTTEQRVAIKDSESYLAYAEQYIEAIMELCKDKELVIYTLVESYLDYKRKQSEAEQVLIDAGFTEKEITLLRAGYFDSQN